MNPQSFKRLGNFIWYQLLWFTAVLGGESVAWLLAALLIIHLATTTNWRHEAMLMLGAAIIGGSLEVVMTNVGYYDFSSTSLGLPIPLWLVSIWMGFAGTLRHSMAWMVAKPRLMVMLAMIGAPLTYLTAGRLGAVAFPEPRLETAVAIGMGWLFALPLLLLINEWIQDREGAALTPQLQPVRNTENYNP